jgi:hypothetical protein
LQGIECEHTLKRHQPLAGPDGSARAAANIAAANMAAANMGEPEAGLFHYLLGSDRDSE